TAAPACPLNPWAITETCVASDQETDGGTKETVFQGADTGDEQAAEGYAARGTFDGWKATVTQALDYPIPRLALLAALSAPLLQLLAGQGARNYTVDICGETSRGKTTTIRLAASAWG